MNRCEWVGKSAIEIEYHDKEWGVAVHDDRLLFEHFVLDCFQAGLSWVTILKKRENFRAAFDNFDYNIIAEYSESKIRNLLNNSGIVKNMLKINATISNAQNLLKIISKYGSFDNYLWKFVNYKTIHNLYKNIKQIPTFTKESIEMSKCLKKNGFKFVGPVICYSIMQATGMVNDHTLNCFRHRELS